MNTDDPVSDRDYYDGRPVGPHDFCENFVKVSADPWAGTYCKLLAGHDGPCSPMYPRVSPVSYSGGERSPTSSTERNP